jgi:hypothetical protein
MKQFSTGLLAAVLFAGCAATPPSGTTPAPAGVTWAYQAATPATLTYNFADSSAFTISGGAIGDIRAGMSSRGVAEIAATPKGTDVEMRIRITDLEGASTNSAMGGTTSVTEADITGEAVLTVTPQGVVTVGQVPTASRAAQQAGIGSSFFRRFVVRFPARPITMGATWTDTITASETSAGINSTVTDIVTSTWARDTTVNGNTLHLITHATQRTLDIRGSAEGVEIAQKLSGTATGHTLWDARRSVVVEKLENTELSGTFDLPAMGLSGLPVSAKGTGRLTLR